MPSTIYYVVLFFGELPMQLRPLIERAQQCGAEQVEISVTQGTGFSVSTRMTELESVEHFQDQHIGITVYRNQQQGGASSTDFSDTAIEQMIQKACHIARYTQPDPCAGPPEQTDLAMSPPKVIADFPWDISIEDAIERTRACEAHGVKQDTRIHNSEGADFSTYREHRRFANSDGFDNTFTHTRHQMHCTLLAEHQGRMQRDSGYTYSHCPQDLWSGERVAKEAADAVLSRLGARPIKTQQAPVVLRADVASGLIQSLLQAISGKAQYRKASFLLDALDQPVLPDWCDLYEDPFVPKGLASCPYDAQGVQVHARHVVEKGQLQTYLLDSYSARKLNRPNTGHAGGPHNIFVSANAGDLNNILQQMGTGLLVTDFMGHGVNMITGDYSRGVSGFWVQNGVIQHPVEEITIAGNLRDMLRHIVAIGTDTDPRKSIACGSILLDAMQIGGI